ncbi:MAG: hypothetical protein K5784_09535, partial [Clostridiales bacterium]|nr:hypothetical protein [Clostridiales bacterium]
MRKLSFLFVVILVIAAIACGPFVLALASYAGSMSGSFSAGASSYYKQNRTPVDPSCAIDGDEYSSWDSYGEYEWAWFELTSKTGRVSVDGLRIMNGKCKSKAYGDEYYYKNARIKRFSLLVDGIYQFSRVIKDTREWQYVGFGKTLTGTSFRILVESVYEGTGTPKGNYGVCITELELIPASVTPAPTFKGTPKPITKVTPTPTKKITPTPTVRATATLTPVDTAIHEGIYLTADDEPMPSDAAEFGKMLNTIEDITANVDLLLKAMGIADIYSENAIIAAEAYLSIHPEVRQVCRAGSGLVFETSDGLLGGFATDKYEPGYAGFSQVSAKDAFETYLEESDTGDIIIPTSATLTNKNVRLLVFDTTDDQMNAIYEFDRRILNDYSRRIGGTFTSYTGQDALKAIRDKSYADSGFLAIAGHGIKMDFWNYNGEFIVPSTFINAGTYDGSEEIFDFVDFDNGPTSKKKDLFFESKGNGRFMVAFRYKWLENISGEAIFDNTLVVPAVCYFGRDNNLINYFLDRGAAAVIACSRKLSLYQHYMSLYALTADAECFDSAQNVESLLSRHTTSTLTYDERMEIVDATSASMSIQERLDLRDIDSFRWLASCVMQS